MVCRRENLCLKLIFYIKGIKSAFDVLVKLIDTIHNYSSTSILPQKPVRFYHLSCWAMFTWPNTCTCKYTNQLHCVWWQRYSLLSCTSLSRICVRDLLGVGLKSLKASQRRRRWWESCVLGHVTLNHSILLTCMSLIWACLYASLQHAFALRKNELYRAKGAEKPDECTVRNALVYSSKFNFN